MKQIFNTKFFILLLILFQIAIIPAFAQMPVEFDLPEKIKTADEAIKLIQSPEPTFKPYQPPKMDASQIADLGIEQVYKSEPHRFTMRDSKKLFASKFSKQSDTTILLLHGILSSSYTYNKMAGLLREATNAEVFALDLRGHGQSEGKPGDVDYINQYADDIADVIAAIKQDTPNEKVILAGHSMGGGIALRFAMKKNAQEVDGFLLFAPLLGQDSPTLPKEEKSATKNNKEPFLKIHISRIIGLKMLNSIGIHQFDSMPILFFNMPKVSPLKNYTYRSNESMSPTEYKEGLKAVKKPLLVIVGSEDEAFVALEYKKAVTESSKGKVIVVEGETHNGIRHSKESMSAVKSWAKVL